MPCRESSKTSSRLSLANPERLVQAAKIAIALAASLLSGPVSNTPDEQVLRLAVAAD